MPYAQLSSLKTFYLQRPCRRNTRVKRDLVAVHGLAANCAFWNIGAASAFNLVAGVTTYDLRGHGRSQATTSGYTVESMALDLKELLDILGLEKIYLVGHSYGGAVSLYFALHYPRRVKKLILADVRLRCIQPVQKLREGKNWVKWEKIFQQAGIYVNPDDPDGGYELLVALAKFELLGSEYREKFPRIFSRMLGRKKKSRVAKQWLQLQETTTIHRDVMEGEGITTDMLNSLEIPVLAIYGEYSHAIPTAKKLTEICPKCKLKIIPRAGHFFPLSHGKNMVRSSLRFLAAPIEGEK